MEKKFYKKYKKFKTKKSNKKKKKNYEVINLLNENTFEDEEINFSFPKFNIFKCIYNIFLIFLIVVLLIFLHNYLKKNKNMKDDYRIKHKYNINNNKTEKFDNSSILLK